MNFSSLIGVAAALFVFITSLFTSTPAREIFLDPHGIFIVVGGTIAASLICFPIKRLADIFKIFFKKIIGKSDKPHKLVIREIIELARGQQQSSNFLTTQVEQIQTPFLKEAVQMLVQGGISHQDIDEILETRINTHYKRYEEESLIFKTMGKFPPAFGLMGTTLGMIALMQKLGAEDAYKSLGPSMAIGLVATLYGIAITNLILIPMGERLGQLTKEDETMRVMVVSGIKLLREKKHPLVVEEFLSSHLLPSERSKI